MSYLFSFSIRQIILVLFWFQFLSTVISLGNVPWRWLSMTRTNLASLMVLSQSRQNPNLTQLWDRCNDMVLSWILNSIDKNLVACLIYHDSAQAVWLDLEARFSQSNNPQIYKLKRDISTMLHGHGHGHGYGNTAIFEK